MDAFVLPIAEIVDAPDNITTASALIAVAIIVAILVAVTSLNRLSAIFANGAHCGPFITCA